MLEPDALRYEDLGADGHVVDLPPADEHRKVLRRQLAERIDLPGFFPAIMKNSYDLVPALDVEGAIGYRNWGECK